MFFEFINKTSEVLNYGADLCQSLIDETFKQLNILEVCELSLIIVDNHEIQEINKIYRQIDKPTDVISFALEDNENLVVEGMPRILGDIFISIDKIKEQAMEYQHSFKREFSFLFVHGLLHLLGYDHLFKEDEEVMFKLQETILKAQMIER